MQAQIVSFLFGIWLKDKKRYTSGKTLEDLSIFRNNKGSTVSRRCRELAEEGIIYRVLINDHFVAYKFKKHLKETLVLKARKKHIA